MAKFSKQLLKLTLFFMICAQPVFSAEKGMDVALVLDTSASMKKNDPNQLRVQAAKLFVSLLSRQDKVSLIGFSNRAYPLTPLLSLNSRKNEIKLLKAIDKMKSNGQFTNLHDAIKGGYDLLKNQKSDNRTRHIILMSDGKMDLGNEDRNLTLLEQTLEDLTPELAKENIKIHTIAFTRDSYIPLLKLAAEDTGGQFIMLKNANGVHQVFENMFERTKNPDMLPLQNDSFVVDKAVKEVTIVASKFKYSSIISVQSPSGDEITRRSHGKNVKWYKARKFDLITIQKPENGFWQIKYSEGGNKAYIVSDIQLEATSTKRHAEPDAPLHIQAQLKKKNRRITNKSLLKSTKFRVKVTSPTGAVIENDLIDDGSEIGSERKDGIYGISYAFEKQGTYKIEVTARGETFDRKKTLFVDVKSETFKTPFTIKATTIDKPDMLDTIGDGIASTENTPPQHENEKQANNNKENNTETTDTKHGDSHNDDSENHKSTTHETQSKHGSNNNSSDHASDAEFPFDENDPLHSSSNGENKELTAEELEANSHFGVKDAVIAFIGFNTLLLTMGGGYYLWYRRKQKQKAKDAKKDDDDDLGDDDSIGSQTNAVTESATENTDIELEPEDELTSSISDIELENELSSILENEKK